MFIRRLYYDSETGEILRSYMMRGDIKPLSAAQEAARLGLENWAVMEWRAPDPEVEQNFADSYERVSVDISGEEPALCFDFSELPKTETREEDMLAALNALGVSAEEGESNG